MVLSSGTMGPTGLITYGTTGTMAHGTCSLISMVEQILLGICFLFTEDILVPKLERRNYLTQHCMAIAWHSMASDGIKHTTG